MKPVVYSLIIVFCILSAGCVSRTVTESKGTRNAQNSHTTNPTSKMVEKKTIWFWQDGFRNPGK